MGSAQIMGIVGSSLLIIVGALFPLMTRVSGRVETFFGYGLGFIPAICAVISLIFSISRKTRKLKVPSIIIAFFLVADLIDLFVSAKAGAFAVYGMEHKIHGGTVFLLFVSVVLLIVAAWTKEETPQEKT
ncbi:MAG: hypothetical protein ACPLN0_07560 [Candidatus Hydrothermia bacterium]